MNSKHFGWSSRTIGASQGCPRRCDVYLPQQPHSQGFGVLWLHDESEERPSETASLLEPLWEEYGLTVVAPDIGRYWWLDRVVPSFSSSLSPQAFLTEIVLPWANDEFQLQPPRMAALGIGMGGQGALMLAYRNPQRFPVVAAVAPKIDFHLLVREGHEFLSDVYDDDEEYARQDTAILHVHPLNWPRQQFFCCDPGDAWFDGADRLRMKLGSTGIPFECDLETSLPSLPAAEHSAAYLRELAPTVLDFVTQRLETERCRLV